MKKNHDALSDADLTYISQSLDSLIPEVGLFAACTTIIQNLMQCYDETQLAAFFKSHERFFPLLSPLSKIVFGNKVDTYITGILSQLAPLFASKKRVLCIGCEAAILDIATRQFEDVQFHVIPHSTDANFSRIESNYGPNVTVHDSFEVSRIYGRDCILLAFGYGLSRNKFYTYPVFCRVVGNDTRQGFARLALAGMCEKPFERHPYELSEIDFQVMSHIFLPWGPL